MILHLTGANDTNINTVILSIKYPDVDYYKWKRTIDYNTDADICRILNDILVSLDCSRIYYGKPIITTNDYNYECLCSDYFRYILAIANQFVYNDYIDKLVRLHEQNLEVEHNRINTVVTAKTNNKKTNKRKGVNKFVRYSQEDIFSNGKHYTYYNEYTNVTIESDDPNLLDELNAPKRKPKRDKSIGVSFNAMTFNFKKN